VKIYPVLMAVYHPKYLQSVAEFAHFQNPRDKNSPSIPITKHKKFIYIYRIALTFLRKILQIDKNYTRSDVQVVMLVLSSACDSLEELLSTPSGFSHKSSGIPCCPPASLSIRKLSAKDDESISCPDIDIDIGKGKDPPIFIHDGIRGALRFSAKNSPLLDGASEMMGSWIWGL